MPSKNNSHKATTLPQKILLAFYGIVLSVVILEMVLRVAGAVFLFLQESRNKGGAQAIRVLCLGESTTMLGGKNAYPWQLEEILNEKNQGRKFKVINEGVAGINTTGILENLEETLDKYEPQVVVVMMGINDTASMPYFKATREYTVKRFFQNFRTYKLIKLIGEHVRAKWVEMTAKDTATDGSPQSHDEAKLLNRLRLEPRNEELYKLLGETYENEGRLPEQEKLFQKAVKVAEHKAWSYELLAGHYAATGKNDSAQAVFRDAISHNPGKTWPYVIYSQYLQKLNKLEEALKILQDGIQHIADRNELLFEVAVIQRALGHSQEAIGTLNVFITQQFKMADSYAELGKNYLLLGNREEAAKYFTQAITSDPVKGQEAVDWLIEQKEFELAERLLLNQKNSSGPSAECFRSLGVLYARWGKPEIAQEYFRKAESLGNDFYLPATKVNYIILARVVISRHIRLVSVQYPMRSLEPLKNLLAEFKVATFVDNERSFKDAVVNESYGAYFVDSFAGDFGHCTPKGNRLLAENVATGILAIKGK